MNKLGIENLKIVLDFPLSLHMAADQAKHNDGKIDLNDIGLVMPPAMKLVPAINSSKEAFAEYKDLDDAERTELNSWVQAKYDIKNDELEEKIEAAFDAAFSVGKLLGAFSKKDEAEAPESGEEQA